MVRSPATVATRRNATNMLRVHLSLLTVQLLFGLWPVAGAAVFRHMPPPALIGFRLTLGAPLLALAAGLLFRQLPSRGDLLRLAALAALGISINQLLFAEGLYRAGPINAALSILLVPAVSMVVAAALGHERLNRRRILGVGLALFGAAIFLEVEQFDLGSRRVVGNLMLVTNACVYALFLVLARPVIARLGALNTIAWVFVFGAVEALPLTLGPMTEVAWLSLPGWAYGSLAFILIGATLVTYTLNAYALRNVESSLVAVYVYLQPVIASVASYILFDDLPTLRTLVAGAVIVCGVTIAAHVVPGLRAALRRSQAGDAGVAPGEKARD